MTGTRKHFSSLHADYLETRMSEVSNVNDGKHVVPNRDKGSPADGVQSRANGAQGSGVTAGMACNQNSAVAPVMVRKADFKDLKSGEDFRGKAAPAAMPAQPAPRQRVGQAPLSGRTPAASAPVSVLGADAVDQN